MKLVLILLLGFIELILGSMALTLEILSYCDVWKERVGLGTLGIPIVFTGLTLILSLSIRKDKYNFNLNLLRFTNQLIGVLAHELATVAILVSSFVDVGPNRKEQYGHCAAGPTMTVFKLISGILAGVNCALYIIGALVFYFEADPKNIKIEINPNNPIIPVQVQSSAGAGDQETSKP